VHAELNAIIQCGRHGVSATGCTMYTSFAPCVQCSLAVAQSGIARVVTWEPDLAGSDAHWNESIEKSRLVLGEVGVSLEHYRR
jgi:dCMP deaminase